MTRHEVQFPTRISFGSSGGPGHNTIFLDSKGGSQTRIGRWGAAIRQYDARMGVQSTADAVELIGFVIAREGGLHSFRYKDWLDYSTDATRVGTAAFGDVVIGTGDGSTQDFQLLTKYTSGSTTKTRNLQAPVTGTVKSGINGVDKAITVDWTVDTTTGVVHYLTAPGIGLPVTSGCQFDVPAHFGPGIDAVFSISIDDFSNRTVPSIPIIEDPSTVPVDDEMHWGGGAALAFTAPQQITSLTARAWSLTPTAAATLLLPSPTQQQAGGPHFFLANLSAFTITVKTGATTIGTIVAGATKTACVFKIGGVNVWRIF